MSRVLHMAQTRLVDATPHLGAYRTGRLTSHDGLLLEAEGLDLAVGAGAQIETADGRVMRAEIVGFRGNRTLLVPLEGTAAYRAKGRVTPDVRPAHVACGMPCWAELSAPREKPWTALARSLPDKAGRSTARSPTR